MDCGVIRLAETNTGTEEAATGLARFTNITKLPKGNIENIANSLTVLGSEFATTENEIQEMSLRFWCGFTNWLEWGRDNRVFCCTNRRQPYAESGGTAMSRVFVDIAVAVDKGGEKPRAFRRRCRANRTGIQLTIQTECSRDG